MTDARKRHDCFLAAVSLAQRKGRITDAAEASESLSRATDLSFILVTTSGAVVGRYLLEDLEAEWERLGSASGSRPSLRPLTQARPRRYVRARGSLVAALAIAGSVLLLISLGSCFGNNLDGFITFAMLGLGCLFLSALVALSFAFF